MNKVQKFVAKVFGIDKKYAAREWALGLAHKTAVQSLQANIELLGADVLHIEEENINLRKTNEILSAANRDLISAAKERNEKMETLLKGAA